MLIEFVGCSGAGKTTFAHAVRAALLDRGCQVAYSPHLIAQVTRSAWLRNERIRNLLTSALLLPWFAKSRRVHRSFYDFSFSIIRRDAKNVWERSSRIRSLIRQIYSFELLRRLETKYDFVLVDECTLGGAHNLFVHVNRLPRRSEILQFASLVPLPDMVVHVDVDTDRALQRTFARHDPPISRGREDNRFEAFIKHGQQVYRELTQCPQVRSRALTVTNSDDDPEQVRAQARQLVESVLRTKEDHERHR